jgi:hypothetical protein
MFSLAFYKVVHLLGVAMVMVSLAGAAVAAVSGEGFARSPFRRLLSIMHGVSGLLVLVGGFGMLARLGVMHGSGFPGWIWVKLVLFFVIGGSLLVPRYFPSLAKPFLVVLPLLVALAAYVAIYKPV